MSEDLEFIWPSVFETKNLGSRPDLALCAYGLSAWAIVQSGQKPHENFGEVMAQIALKLGISGTPESFMELSKRLMPKYA